MTKIITEKNVEIPMRDGTVTRADVIRESSIETAPVILQRFPYDKDSINTLAIINPIHATQRGYIVVIQDTRGRFNSDGGFNPFFHEQTDGYDTVEWIAEQPWCNGKVGMFGSSYYGVTQWLAASQKPPHLYAMIPFVTASNYYDGWTYQGGAFQLGFNLFWTYRLAADFLSKQIKDGKATIEDLEENIIAQSQIDEQYKVRPLQDAVNENIYWYKDWLQHYMYDDYWKKVSPKEFYKEIDIPVFNVGGWFDIFIGGTIENYIGMKNRKGNLGTTGNQLLIGPWSHGDGNWGIYPDINFGIYASSLAINLQEKCLRFFDYWLKEEKNQLDNEKPVEIFVMGENRWYKEKVWPLANTEWTNFYFHSNGKANTRIGDGKLSVEKPTWEIEDIYLYDPRNPVPTLGGQTLLTGMNNATNQGPKDQREVENRSDVLCYTSDPLETKLKVIGPIKAILYTSSSAKDTDFTVKLVDVHPNGKAIKLTEGIIRGRFRNSLEHPELLVPGEIYRFEIDMLVTGNVFLAGHQIRVEVSSSNFPRFDANTNTGGNIAEETYEDMTQAVNRIFHNETYPSHIILPIIS